MIIKKKNSYYPGNYFFPFHEMSVYWDNKKYIKIIIIFLIDFNQIFFFQAFKIILIDNASTTDQWGVDFELACHLFRDPKIKFLRLKIFSSSSFALATAAEVATGEILLFFHPNAGTV